VFFNNKIYKCLVGTWCSASTYAPEGAYSDAAWSDVTSSLSAHMDAIKTYIECMANYVPPAIDYNAVGNTGTWPTCDGSV